MGAITMNDSGKCTYLRDFVRKGFLLAALLFAAVMTAVLVSVNEFGLAAALVSDKKLLVALAVICVYYALVTLIGFFGNLKRGSVSLFDSFFWACLFAGVLYVLYFVIILQKTSSIIHWAIGLGLAVIGLIFIIINAVRYKSAPASVAPSADGIGNKVADYYNAVNNKYSFFLIVLFSALITVCAFLGIFNAHSFGINTKSAIILALCALPVLLYLIFGVSDKTIGLFDFALLALALSVPCIFVLVGYGNFSGSTLVLYFSLAGAVFIIALFYSVLRWICSDPKAEFNYIPAKKTGRFDKYFSAFSAKFNLLLAISCGSVLTVITLVLFRFTSFGFYAQLLADGSAQGLNSILIYLISAVCYLSLILFGIIAFVNIKSPKVNIGDFALMVCLSYSVFGLLSFINVFSRLGCVILAITLLLSLTILAARIKNVVSEN